MEIDGIGTKTEGMTDGVGAPTILIRRYGTAMLLMVLFLIGSFVMQHVATREKVDDAAQINIAGRQRMLSQRILYLSHLPKDALDANRAELTQLLTQFNNAFVALSSDPNLSSELRDAYFASTNAVVGQSLADMVREFYASGRNFVEGRQPEAALLTLERLGSQQMLTKLEAVVTTYQIEARARAVLIDRLASISLIGALLTLLFEGVAIFWPTVAMVRRALGQNEIYNARIVAFARKLRVALDQSEALRREQGAFTYSLSHELRAPGSTLAGLLGELSGIVDASPDREGADLLEMSIETVKRMNGMLASVLDYSEVVNAVDDFRELDFDVAVAAVLHRFRQDLKGVEIRCKPLGFFPANPTQMAILFNCLLQNAGKFRSVSRGLVLDIWAEHGALGEMTLCLGDNGIGVAAASREAVFGMFKRLHVRSDYPGDGIGLAICARVAQAHQGGIVMRDGLTGQGVVVAVTLMRPEAAELGFAAPETDLVTKRCADSRAA